MGGKEIKCDGKKEREEVGDLEKNGGESGMRGGEWADHGRSKHREGWQILGGGGGRGRGRVVGEGRWEQADCGRQVSGKGRRGRERA